MNHRPGLFVSRYWSRNARKYRTSLAIGDPYAAVAIKQRLAGVKSLAGPGLVGADGSVFRRTAELWPSKEIVLTSGMESSADSRLSCVSCRLARGRVTDATLVPVGLTYT